MTKLCEGPRKTFVYLTLNLSFVKAKDRDQSSGDGKPCGLGNPGSVAVVKRALAINAAIFVFTAIVSTASAELWIVGAVTFDVLRPICE